MDGFMRALVSVWTDSGFAALTIENIIMNLVGIVLLYLAIAKEYEPLLLMPIAFGDIMANFPNTGFETDMGVMMAIGFGIKYEIFPPLIFMGVGAMTDFGPLIANPKTMLLGAAAQIGVFVALAGAMILGFNVQEAASIGIIGGADGPTSIYLTSKLAPHLLGAVAVAGAVAVVVAGARVQKLFDFYRFHTLAPLMLRTASSVQGMISIIPSTVIPGIVTVNLQFSGAFPPSVASWDKLAAPSQYHSLRQSPRSASAPLRSAIFAKNTPARSHRMM